MRLVALCLLAFGLAACAAAGPAAYGPADERGFGFDEQKIEDGRYRVIYGGSGGMPPGMVEDYALRRAAELTLGEGYDWFRIVGSDLVGEERGGVGVGAGFGTGSYGRRSSVGVGVGGDFGRVGAQEYFTARIEILMGSGEPPAADDVFDARSVLDNIATPDALPGAP